MNDHFDLTVLDALTKIVAAYENTTNVAPEEIAVDELVLERLKKEAAPWVDTGGGAPYAFFGTPVVLDLSLPPNTFRIRPRPRGRSGA